MDTCMLKSRAIEGDSKKDHGHKDDLLEHSSVGGIIAKKTEHEVDENTSDAEKVTEITTRHRTRRIMFAEDLYDSDENEP